jgi:2-polyprenyl-3-methyl-5-hydroxy-6-metoxy-1,4-benzoquinol methylase
MDFFKKSFELSWKKASDVLNYQPKASFSAGILETVRWYAKMGFINNNLSTKFIEGHDAGNTMNARIDQIEKITNLKSKFNIAAQIEPFDSFWEAPDDIEKGYSKFGTFYKYNYLKYFPSNKQAKILIISCGPGYMVNLLNQNGYMDVLGIDSMPEKLAYAVARNLNCKAARAFDYLDENRDPYDVIFCEQEINHLTKEEIFMLLEMCKKNLREKGTLIIHSLNGANPVVGSENLALNFDHFNLLTEKSLIQLLEHCKFRDIKPIPLRLYVFYKNPANYIGLILDAVMTKLLQYTFKFYGKNAKIFTKKIAAVCKN